MYKPSFAVLLLLILHVWQTQAQTTHITGPTGSGNYGKTVTVLTNGNYVIADPLYDEGGIIDRGAVYLYNGSTHALISTLKGGTLNDQIGSDGVIALTNGNFVVISPLWNSPTVDVGAVTWGNGITGISGLVSSSNSLVGTAILDKIGSAGVIPLTNGNYVVSSPLWNSGAVADVGAVTWGNGTTGRTGAVSATNSLVGGKANDNIGSGGAIALTNGNYVVSSPLWDNSSIVDAGAVTWGNGATGRTGTVAVANSLVGGKANDAVGSGGAIALTNGNYVTHTNSWHNGIIANVGAVTWGNGTSGATGTVSATNSLVGGTADDIIGSQVITPLTNGNYVIASPKWSKGSVLHVGAITWCSGTTGRVGPVTTTNSLVGGTADDNIGSGGVAALTNGNYVVESSVWNNGAIADAGAATWGNGVTGSTGIISSSNSLVGTHNNDNVCTNVVPLTNGNYVVRSSVWDNGTIVDAGAATWGNGATGITGAVTAINSLVGTSTSDKLTSGGVTALTNGNYVVRSQVWNNGAMADVGAATFGNGSTGITGPVTSANSLIGGSATDNVSNSGVTALSNGNYVVISRFWNNGAIADAGAVTWGNGVTGTTGIVSAGNSLVGSTATDNVGIGGVTAFSNGDYAVFSSNWDNGALVNASAITYGIGTTGISGIITNCNSVLGGMASPVAPLVFDYNSTYDYLIVGRPVENIVSVYRPGGMGLAITLDNKSLNILGASSTPLIANAGCRIIANLIPNGGVPVGGNISAKVWVESAQPVDFVKRHYEITPLTNPVTSTGRVTLYFTQSEFDDYNAVNTVKLPTGPTDVADFMNLLVENRGGTSGNASGLPNTYTGTITTIDPAESDIVWNGLQSRWEISFDATGFSGLFLKTGLAVLPLRLMSFSAMLHNNDGLLSWKITGETNTLSFDVERSADGRVFEREGTVKASNTAPGDHVYQYTDAGVTTLRHNTIYYRLKQTDNDGRSSYSSTVVLHLFKDNSLSVYPNPASAVATLRINNGALLHTTAILTDLQGIRVRQFTINNYQERIDINNLARGLYVLKLADGTSVKLNKN